MAATQINLADPEAMRRELPQARRLYESKLADLKELHQEVEHLRAIVEHMAALVGEPLDTSGAVEETSGKRGKQPAPAQQAAAAVIHRARRPMRPREVATELGKDANAVGAALWAAAKNGLVKKLEAGLYAPRDYIPPPESLLPDGEGKK
jgi:hypothetical protein